MNVNRLSLLLLIVLAAQQSAAQEPSLDTDNRSAASESPRKAAAADAKADEPTTEQINRWIAQLDSDEYWTREDANKRLFRAGKRAIGALSQAARSEKLEVTRRAIGVLGQFLDVEDPAIELAAETALEEIAAGRVTSAAAHAESALVGYRGNRQDRVLAKLRQLGATVSSTVLSNGEFARVEIRIGDGWRGNAGDLAVLKSVQSLTHLSIFNMSLDEEAVKHLSSLKQLIDLQLYGTGISNTGMERLTQELTSTTIDHRKGGLLGVSGNRLQRGGGCLVMTVAPNTAAAQAGLQPGDIITKFDDSDVEDFESLTSLIKHKAGGDSVELEVQREIQVGEKTERQTLKKKVTLGKWSIPVVTPNIEFEGQIIFPRR
jgi:hypothetical protein